MRPPLPLLSLLWRCAPYFGAARHTLHFLVAVLNAFGQGYVVGVAFHLLLRHAVEATCTVQVLGEHTVICIVLSYRSASP